MVRRANVYFSLKAIKQLTDKAMASVDAEYWTKCIEHMFKEVHYYMLHDGVGDDENSESVIESDVTETPMIIDVSFIIFQLLGHFVSAFEWI